MKKKPNVRPVLSTTDKTIEFLGWLSILVIWSFTTTNYINLPDTIPTHYDASGQADEFGGKATILILPLVATVMFAGLTIVTRLPRVFNYQAGTTKEDAHRQHTIAAKVIRYLKFMIVVIVGVITFYIIQTSKGKAEGLEIWFLPVVIGSILILLTYFLVKLFKKSQ